jgi:hypothetical protein
MLHTAWLILVTLGSLCGLLLGVWAAIIRLGEWRNQRRYQRLVAETNAQDEYLRFLADKGTSEP